MNTSSRQRSARRVLIVGPPNANHVEDFARELSHIGVEVFVAGGTWSGGLPPSTLPDAGIPVFTPARPTTLWLRWLIHKLRPSVVHAHWLPYGVWALISGARPLVATAWGSDVYLASWRRRASYLWLLRRAQFVLADSQDLLAALRRLGASPARSCVHSWGVDLSVFSLPSREKEDLRHALGIGPGPVMLSVRGFKDIYNPGVVIGAFERLAERYRDLQLVLKHNSAQPPTLPALQFADRVHVVGPQPAELLADWFRAASVCVSIPSSDSSPRSVWEAMACGCPCVVSDLPWAHQELRPEQHALLAPVTVEAVAARVERLLDDPGVANQLSVAGRTLVENHHDLGAQMGKIVELYDRLSRM